MSAQCNRVAVEDVITESISVRLKTKAKREEIIAVWNDYRSEPQVLKLPSAPGASRGVYGGGGSSTSRVSMWTWVRA